MPINLIDYSKAEKDEPGIDLGAICKGEWDLTRQMDALSEWLIQTGQSLKPGRYLADIGFSPRDGASGGGPVLSVKSMEIMARIGMQLNLSEYPND